MKILLIDCTLNPTSWGSRQIALCLRTAGQKIAGTEIRIRRAPEGDLPKDPAAFDRIVISGSRASCLESPPWVVALDDFVRRAVRMGKPILGICYGHQTLARALGSTQLLRPSARPEFGWAKIEIKREDPLFSGLGKSFYSFEAHEEELAVLPPDFELLAQSADCAIQAMRMKSGAVYGIQFHPERTPVDAERTFAEKRADKQKTGKGPQLLRPADSAKLYRPQVAEQIFSHFLNLPTDRP